MKFLLVCVSTLFTGLYLAFMWRWFITPLGVPAISILHAVGLCFIIGIMFGKKDPKAEVDVERILYIMLYDTIGFVFAFITHLAM